MPPRSSPPTLDDINDSHNYEAVAIINLPQASPTVPLQSFDDCIAEIDNPLHAGKRCSEARPVVMTTLSKPDDGSLPRQSLTARQHIFIAILFLGGNVILVTAAFIIILALMIFEGVKSEPRKIQRENQSASDSPPPPSYTTHARRVVGDKTPVSTLTSWSWCWESFKAAQNCARAVLEKQYSESQTRAEGLWRLVAAAEKYLRSLGWRTFFLCFISFCILRFVLFGEWEELFGWIERALSLIYGRRAPLDVALPRGNHYHHMRERERV